MTSSLWFWNETLSSVISTSRRGKFGIRNTPNRSIDAADACSLTLPVRVGNLGATQVTKVLHQKCYIMPVHYVSQRHAVLGCICYSHVHTSNSLCGGLGGTAYCSSCFHTCCVNKQGIKVLLLQLDLLCVKPRSWSFIVLPPSCLTSKTSRDIAMT